MKKLSFLALALGMVLTSACSNSDDNNVVDEGAGAQRISIAVENAGSGLSSRAGRELLSSEAKQSIENVMVYIVDGANKVQYRHHFKKWNDQTDSDAKAYTDGGHGRKAEFVLSGDNKLAQGDYTVYAFGYHNSSAYDLSTLTGYEKGDTFDPNVVISTAGVTAEEIFAGQQSISVPAPNANGQGFRAQVILHRQVAGVFVYTKEVPYMEGGAKLTLYASQNLKSLALGHFVHADGNELANNGSGNTNNKVINGSGTATADVAILTTNLADWYNDVTLETEKHVINGDAANWKGDAAYYQTGSVFMGGFLVPFLKNANNTFVLRLEDAGGNELRAWNISLPDPLTTATTIWSYDGTAFQNTDDYTETASVYSIFRNHLYGIGLKTTDAKDDDPTKEDPQSLNTKQDLILKVNDNWELLHTMVVE